MPTFALRLAALAAAVVVAAPSPAAAPGGGVTARVLERIQEARSAAAVPPLERLRALDETASRRARRIAALPHRRRLASGEPIEAFLKEDGLRFPRASEYVALERDYRDAGAAILERWKSYAPGWSLVTNGGFDAVGLATARAEDGWLVFVAVLARRPAPPPDLRALEERVFREVNEVRASRGLGALAPSAGLADVARAHSEEMAGRGRLDHESVGGLGPGDRVRRNGLRFRSVAENLALNDETEDPAGAAVEQWMLSPPHRANLLDPDFTQTGVGIAADRDGTLYFTQLFLR